MSRASEILAIIQQALADTDGGDPDLSAVVDGVFSRYPINRLGPKQTSLAFNNTEGSPKVSVVVPEAPLYPHPQLIDGVPLAANAALTVWLYGPDNDDGWDALESLRPFIRGLFADEMIQFQDGLCWFPIWSGELSTRPNRQELQNSIVANVQFSVAHQLDVVIPVVTTTTTTTTTTL